MTTAFEQFMSDPKKMRVFQQEMLAAEITELMCRTMSETKISRSALANKLNITKGRISQILASESNLTVRTIADIFTAMGKQMVVDVKNLFEDYESKNTLQRMDEDYTINQTPWSIAPFFSQPSEQNDSSLAL
jgi:transcriptional regulator with XRE-family HTH domain